MAVIDFQPLSRIEATAVIYPIALRDYHCRFAESSGEADEKIPWLNHVFEAFTHYRMSKRKRGFSSREARFNPNRKRYNKQKGALFIQRKIQGR